MTKKTLAAVTVVGTALALPALAAGHATISSSQSGPNLTSARGSYVLRVPNEKAAQSTFKLVLDVPAPVREAISVKQVPGWKVRFTKEDTGRKNDEGAPVLAITKISWTAATPADEIEPSMYGEFPVRFRNPASAQSLCFPMRQSYRTAAGERRNAERVFWTGGRDSDFPASCIEITAAP